MLAQKEIYYFIQDLLSTGTKRSLKRVLKGLDLLREYDVCSDKKEKKLKEDFLLPILEYIEKGVEAND